MRHTSTTSAHRAVSTALLGAIALVLFAIPAGAGLVVAIGVLAGMTLVAPASAQAARCPTAAHVYVNGGNVKWALHHAGHLLPR